MPPREEVSQTIYVKVSRIADKLGLDRKMVLRTLVKNGGAVKMGRCWYTTRRKLRAVFPEAWEEISDMFDTLDANAATVA
jgi:hypothetical protein